MKVRKRNGSLQGFEKAKIKKAIAAAIIQAKGSVVETELDAQTSGVEAKIFDLKDDVIDIDKIEKIIISSFEKDSDEKKAYLDYKNKRARIRRKESKPSLKPLADYILTSKYASRKEDGTLENYKEMISRVENMHLEKFKHLGEDVTTLIREAFKFSYTKKSLPSARALHFAGPRVIKHELAQYNCSASLIDRPRVFSETLYALLCGCGVGFSIQKEHVEKLPRLVESSGKVQHIKVRDDIIGWAEGLDHLMASYFIHGHFVELDYSSIRPEGSPLKSAGGIAPGHLGYRAMIEDIRKMLDNKRGTKLRPIHCHDLMCRIAECVLSGGIRRSSLISIFSFDDDEMLHAKTPENFRWAYGNDPGLHPYRAMSNNSCAFTVGETTKEDFDRLMDLASDNMAEPGFFFTADKAHLTNPCLSPDSLLYTSSGTVAIGDYEGGSFDVLCDTRVTREGAIDSPPRIVSRRSKPIRKTQEGAQLYRLTTASGHTVECTANHKFPNTSGVHRLDELAVGDEILIVGGSTTVRSIDKTILSDVYCLEEPVSNSIIVNGIVTGNCSEASLCPTIKRENGTVETGFQFCNLTEICVANTKTKEDFVDACKAASIIGTLQAAYTDFKYLGQTTIDITEREALLGVGLTGLCDNPSIGFDPETLRAGAKAVVETNKMFAKMLGINPAARCTVIKPSGTISLLLGGVASGIHPHHWPKYIRGVTANPNEPAAKLMKKVNPHAVSVKPNGDYFIEFPCETNGITLKDQSGLDFIDNVETVMKNWIIPGMSYDTHNPGAMHNVSSTCTVRKGEEQAIKDKLWPLVNKGHIKAMAFAPGDLDENYDYLPRKSVKTPEDEAHFNYLVSNWVDIDYSEMKIEESEVSSKTQVVACAGGACEII